MDSNKRPNKFKSLVEVPDSVSLEMPDLELKIVEKNEPFTFSRKSQKRKFIFEIIIGIISIAGVCIGLFFAKKANDIASDNQKQETMINQLKEIVDSLKSSNINIAQTQENTYKLLLATLQQNKDFNKSNDPIITLRSSGSIRFDEVGNHEGFCPLSYEYFVENKGNLIAENLIVDIFFVREYSGQFETFQYLTEGKKLKIDLSKDKPIEFRLQDLLMDCKRANYFRSCFVIFEYKYNSILSNSQVEGQTIFKQSVIGGESYRLKKMDSKESKKLLTWYSKNKFK